MVFQVSVTKQEHQKERRKEREDRRKMHCSCSAPPAFFPKGTLTSLVLDYVTLSSI